MKRDDYKLRILLIERMLCYERVITSSEIIRRLEECGIFADRKTVYDDIWAITGLFPLSPKAENMGDFGSWMYWGGVGMATEKRLIDANTIPWEEYYVPDPDRNAQWDFKKELSVSKPVVDKMPTVDAVEVVHGRWETHNQVDSVFYCSECKLNVSGFERRWLNYCPNCGAKMDGEMRKRHE